jgi:hypothetical protein
MTSLHIVDWIPVYQNVPRKDTLVLVTAVTHPGMALGKMNNDGKWTIQPFAATEYTIPTYPPDNCIVWAYITSSLITKLGNMPGVEDLPKLEKMLESSIV